MMKLRFLIFGLVILVGGFLFYRYGRSLYIPVIQKVKGKQTVSSIKEKVEADVLKRLLPNLNKLGYDSFPEKIVLAGFKKEQVLEVYVVDKQGTRFLISYPFTAFSGKIGPKLKEGDRQIPEGIYQIEYLNPNSSYYLSMKVDYPNEFDKQKASEDNRKKLGGDIFIHGKSATIGCIPVGDTAIEELFILVAHAMNRGVKVIISPTDFRTTNTFPEIEAISWEEELYTQISKAVKSLPSNH